MITWIRARTVFCENVWSLWILAVVLLMAQEAKLPLDSVCIVVWKARSLDQQQNLWILNCTMIELITNPWHSCDIRNLQNSPPVHLVELKLPVSETIIWASLCPCPSTNDRQVGNMQVHWFPEHWSGAAARLISLSAFLAKLMGWLGGRYR